MKIPHHLNSRQTKALQALEDNPTLYFHDLPTFVGRTTMAELVKMGLVVPGTPNVGLYSKNFTWKRVR